MANITLAFAEFFLFPGQKAWGHVKQLLLAYDVWPLTELALIGQGNRAHKNASKMVTFQGCLTFCISGPHWKEKSCLRPHIKYTNTNEN